MGSMGFTNGEIVQIAHVVWNIDKKIEFYWNTLGIGPWEIYTLKPPLLRESLVNGISSDHTYIIALAKRENLQFELIQPLTGKSIYDDFLKIKGEGLHHIKFYHDDCQKAIEEYKKKGFKVIQSGKIDDDEFYYLNTYPKLDYVIELGNNGTIREPERVFPNSFTP